MYIGKYWARDEYLAWWNMLDRCQNLKNKGYHSYGGRGIKVCKRWRDFRMFFSDVGEKPRPHFKFSLDRVNNDGNYEPRNCRWATRKVQTENKSGYQRRTKYMITHAGITRSLGWWASAHMVPWTTLARRLAEGISFEESLLEPARANKRSRRTVRLKKLNLALSPTE